MTDTTSFIWCRCGKLSSDYSEAPLAARTPSTLPFFVVTLAPSILALA